MNCKDPANWKTKNPMEDVEKFELVRSGYSTLKRKTIDLQIQQVQTIHKNFPHVRFYGFHKTAERFADKHYGCMWDYVRCSRLPDGYFIDPSYGIFIIEIENYSRVDKQRIDDYMDWWLFFDGIEYTAIHIMEFNRFGNFQRDIIKETFDERESVEILKTTTIKNMEELKK